MIQAGRNRIQSIAFSCISPGEFHFSNQRAVEIAMGTVKKCKKQTPCDMKMIIYVFKDENHRIYKNHSKQINRL